MAHKIADGFGQLGPLEDYHYSFSLGDKLVLVGRKYVGQPSHNWGHRVAFAGTYVLSFDKNTNNWERHDFPELVSDENSDERLFVKDGTLYLLTFTNFGAIEFKKLFKWENNSFEEIKLESFAAKTTQEGSRTEVLVANGVTSNGETIILTPEEQGIQFYALAINGSTATITTSALIPREDNFLNGIPTLAEVHGNQVLVSYGVHGCGFRWESNRLFLFNLNTQTNKSIDVAGDYSVLPHFCFTGPETSFVNPATNTWIVAAGTVQQGMTGSAHYGAVWALKDVFNADGTPTWVELPQTVEEGDHILDGLTLFTITKDSVVKVQIESV